MASYVNSILQNGEIIKFRTKLHWIIFLLWFIVCSIFAIPTSGISYVFMLIPIILYITSEFCITNKRVIIKKGFISRQTIEMLLEKVEGVSYDQGIVGRLLGYGTIVIRGTGGTPQKARKVAKPMFFQQAVTAEIENAKKPDLSQHKVCPECAEHVKKEALKCKHCGCVFSAE